MNFLAYTTRLHVAMSLAYGGWCVYEEAISPPPHATTASAVRRSHPFTAKGAAMMKMNEYNYDRARQLQPKYDL